MRRLSLSNKAIKGLAGVCALFSLVIPVRVLAQRPSDPETAAVVDVGINILNDARSVLLRADRAIDRGGVSVSKAARARSAIVARERELFRLRRSKITSYVQALEDSDSAKILGRVVPQLEAIFGAALIQYAYIAAGSCLPIDGYSGFCIPLPWNERREVLSGIARTLGRVALYAEEISKEGDEALRELSASFHKDPELFGINRFKSVRGELLEAYKRGVSKAKDLLVSTNGQLNAACGSLYQVTSFLYDIDVVSQSLVQSSGVNWGEFLDTLLQRYSSEFPLWTTCRAERLNALEAVEDTLRLARQKGDRRREEEADRERLTLIGEIWGLNREIEAIDVKQRIFSAVKSVLSGVPLEHSKIAGVVALSVVREGVLNAATSHIALYDALTSAASVLASVDEERDESRTVALHRLSIGRIQNSLRMAKENKFLGVSFFHEMSDSLRSSLNETLWSSERYRQLLTKALADLSGERSKFASIASLEATSEAARGELLKAGDEYRVQLRRRVAIDDQIAKVNALRRKLRSLLSRSNVYEIYKTVLRDFVQKLSIHPYYPNLQPELDESLSQLTRVFGSGIKVPSIQSISPRTRIVRQALLARRRIQRQMTRVVNSESERLIGAKMTDIIGALNWEKRILERSFPLQ